MSNTEDPDDMAVSVPPSSEVPSRPDLYYRSMISEANSSANTPLVGKIDYRTEHLRQNGIRFLDGLDSAPDDIKKLIDEMHEDRASPGPSAKTVQQDEQLHYVRKARPSEAVVEDYFLNRFFPNYEWSHSLWRVAREPMAQGHVPNNKDCPVNVSNPKPGLLYGYKKDRAFPQHQDLVERIGEEMRANDSDLAYPFLVIEFEAEGTLWAAENQCIGGSATCVNIAENLNRRLEQCRSVIVDPINSAVFGVAIRCTQAELFVSWMRNDGVYVMAEIGHFYLTHPERYIRFYKLIHNIIDWGKGKRLEGIRKALDSLQAESRRRPAKRVKSTRAG